MIDQEKFQDPLIPLLQRYAYKVLLKVHSNLSLEHKITQDIGE